MKIIELLTKKIVNERDDSKDFISRINDFTLIEDLTELLGINPYFNEFNSPHDIKVKINNKQDEYYLLCSNNYLGLSNDSSIIQKAQDAIKFWGTSPTGTRIINGNQSIHIQLEKKLSEFLGTESTIVFPTGYQACLGLISALINNNDKVILDEFAHASLVDGTYLAQKHTGILRFKHNNPESLRAILKEKNWSGGTLIVIDGIYSSHGDIACLPDIYCIAKEYEAHILIDDAHALGVIGNGGRGTCSHFNIIDDNRIIKIGTFSKSLASIGGYVSGGYKLINYLRYHSRPFIFSAGLSSSNTAAALSALEKLIEQPELQEKVIKNACNFRKKLTQIGISYYTSQSAITAFKIGDEEKTLRLWKEFYLNKLLLSPGIYPTVRKGDAILRATITSSHDEETINEIDNIIRTVWNKM